MTKRLLGLSLLAILILAGSAFAANNMNVWYGGTFTGNTWHDTTYVPISSPWTQPTAVDIPVYALTDPAEGSILAVEVFTLHLPLGVLDGIIDDIPLAACQFNLWEPFATPPGWDDASFLPIFVGAPPSPVGYHTRSFLGLGDTGGGSNAPLVRNPNVGQIMKFNIHFVAVDTAVVYNVMADGGNEQNYGPGASNFDGSINYNVITHYSKIVFVAVHNQSPVITCSTADLHYHTGAACRDFTVIDPDGDPVTVTAVGGVVTPLGGPNYRVCYNGAACQGGEITINAQDNQGGQAAPVSFNVVFDNAAPVIVYGGVNPVTTTSVQPFDITDADGDVISYTISGTCAVTITTNVAGHIAGTIACASSCNGTITFNANDPCGAQAAPVSFVVNILNSAPVIHAQIGPVDICAAEECFPFTVTDDGIGTIVVSADHGTIITDSYVVNPGVSSIWTGKICFDPTTICAPVTYPTVTISATDGMDAAVPYVFGPFVMKPVIKVDLPDTIGQVVGSWTYGGFWPGYVDSIPVYMDAADCFCMGAYELTVMYDASIFNVIRVDRGEASVGAELFVARYNVVVPSCPENYGRTGALDVTMVWDLPNQTNPPTACPQGTILFWIIGEVPDGAYQTNYCVPICFYMCGANNGCGTPGFVFDPNGMNYQWNSITNITGLNLWKTEGCCDIDPTTYYLDLNCGNIKINRPGDIPPGDVNHNGEGYEVGDVVLLANYLGYHTPLDHYQWYASDINGDGVPATIADLVMLIRIVTGQIPIPQGKVAPINVNVEANMTGNNVTISSEADLGGAVFTVNHTGEIGVPSGSSDIKYSDNNGVLTVLVYSDAGTALGHNLTINVPVVSGTANLVSASAADINGAMLNAKVTAPLPTEFSVAQNYPNPFNVKTAIHVALPTTANVTISIYNVAGQLVEAINAGELAAGTHSIIWDASNVGSGVYFYKVVAGDQTKTMKMTLLK